MVTRLNQKQLELESEVKFEDIQYGARSGSPASDLGLLLPGGYWVQRCHFDLAWTLICAGLPTADLSNPKTAKAICNDPTWNDRACGVRIKLGRCIKYFVANEMLPLRLINEEKRGPRKYARK